MKTTTTNFNNLINNGFPYHYVNLYLDNVKLDVTFKSFNYYGLINSGEGITIGSTCASYVEFELYNQSTSLENEEVQVKVGIDVNGTIENVSLGFFTITKPTNKDEVSKYVAYDRMIKLEKLYVSSLSNPTVKRIMNEIGTQTGYGFKDTLTNDINIDALKIKGYTYREIIGYLSALYGANCVINDIGQIEFKIYKNSNIVIERNKIYENGLELSSDNIFKIEYLKCATGETVEHTSTDEEGEEVINTEDVILSIGAGTTGITISNPLMTQSILENIYNTYLKNLTYRPCKVNMIGDITIECGDIVSVNDGANTYNVPIMNLKHSIDGGITTNIEAVSQTESEQEINFTGPTIKYVERVYSELIEANEMLANKIQASNITTDYLETHYAKIDLANIKDACITTAMIGTEVVGTSQIANSSITDAKIVELTANKITAGTLSCDRLVINGSDKSLVYYLNNMGDLTSTQVNTINGDTLTPRSITADKIVANAITSNEIASKTITANEIKAGTITANEIATYTITADEIASRTITSAEIKTGTITANEIKSGTITADKINVSDLFAKDITATGTITGITLKGANLDLTNGISMTNDNSEVGIITQSVNSLSIASADRTLLTLDGGLGVNIGTQYANIQLSSNYIFMKAGEMEIGDEGGCDMYLNASVRTNDLSPSSVSCSGEGSFSRVISEGSFGSTASHSTSVALYCKWKDGSNHNLAYKETDGLSAYFGWNGSSSYATVSTLRGYTVALACNGNGGGSANANRIDFKDINGNVGFYPASNNATYLGHNSYRWKGVYTTTIYVNGTQQHSDRRLKNNINYDIDNDFEDLIYNGVKPTSYCFNDDDKKITRYGIIAQDLRDWMINNNKDLRGYLCIENKNMDQSANVDLNTNEDEVDYYINYIEFIAPLIKVVQKQKKEIDELKDLVNKLINK